MKKLFFVLVALIVLGGCSKQTELTGDITGTWYIYKLTLFNVDQTTQSKFVDTLSHYQITFANGGQFVEKTVLNVSTTHDTIPNTGTWAFQNNYGQLVLTDSINKTRTYTMLNLQGNHVELLKDGETRYMRKTP